MSYGLILKKENFKFSSSHFTIFSADSAEGLHGHNYQVGARLAFKEVDEKLEMKVDFNVIKEKIRGLCEELDEKILIPNSSPFLKITESPHYKNHTLIQYNDRHYCFPTSEIVFLPMANITSEALARYFNESLGGKFKKDFTKITIIISETAGQSATFTS